MTINGVLQLTVYLLVVLLLARPLGGYMARVYQGELTLPGRLLAPMERFIYRLAGVHPESEMTWWGYAVSLLVFSAIGILILYALQRIQGLLPLNPQTLGPVTPAMSLNAAASFVSNTNWQTYSGETTMSYLTQMLGMTVQNFASAATGMAVLAAFTRGLARHSSSTLGNFWVDLTRGVLYILLPLALVLALILVTQGVVQTLTPAVSGSLVQPVMDAEGNPVVRQVLATGPAASQIAIKQLGSNGGGFFNANSAHPFENPTPLSNFLEMVAILLIPAALCITYGKMVGDVRQGWALLAAMTVVLVIFVAGAYMAEAAGNPRLAVLGADLQASNLAPGGNMEGKELRIGVANSALWATATTATSNGSVNAMHDSFSPLGGLVPLILMQLGEVVFGGVGSGLYGMLVFVIVAVFVAGLMVGRTPEYLGKKIEGFEIKMAALLILIPPMVVLGLTALAVTTQAGKAAVFNPGPHGFSEVLYAFTSMGNNNGSAFAGLGANTPFYNVLGALAMLVARFWLIVPTLALAGSLARKRHVPAGAGTLPTHTALFVGWLVAIILIVGALNYLPALALGPIVEHLIL